MVNKSRPRWRKILGLVLHRALQAVAAVLSLATLLMVLMYASGTFRSNAVGWGLELAADVIPGDLQVGEISWPELGHLRLTNVVWKDGGSSATTLVKAPLLELAWDMGALRNGHVDADSVLVVADHVDLPAILALFQPSVGASEEKSASADSVGSLAPLHSGSLPGIPSLSVGQWRVQCQLAAISPELTLQNVDGAGSLELGFERPPSAEVDYLQLDLALTVEDSTSSKIVTFSVERFSMAAGFTVDPDEKISLALDALRLEFDNLFLSSLLPAASGPPQEFDEVSGRILASGSYVAPLIAGMFDVNLESTQWLERGRLTGRVIVDAAALPDSGLAAVAVTVDSLALALLGSEIFAQGELARRHVNMQLKAAVPDSQALSLIWPDSLAPPVIRLDLDATMAGTLQEFDLDLDLTGQLDLPQVTAPQIDLHVHGNRSAGSLELQLPWGISAGGAVLDSVVVMANIDQASDRSLSGGYSLALKRGQDELRIGGRVQTDSLSVSSPKTVVIDSLVFGGHGQSLRLQEPAVVVIGPEPGFFSLSPFEFSGDPGSINLGGEISKAGMEFNSVISLFVTEEQLDGMVPNEFWGTNGGKDFSLESQIELGGTFAEPILEGNLIAKLLPHRDDPDIGVAVDFAMVAGDSAGVVATMAITSNDSTLLRAKLNLPGEIDIETGVWTAQDSMLAVFRIPDQTLNLGHVNRVLPPEIELVGEVSAGLAVTVLAAQNKGAQASPSNARVDGKLSTKDLVINLPNRSRIDTSFDLNLIGPLDHPKMTGEITVASAFIRLPELPRNVHDFEGESELWALAAADSAASDSIRIFVVPEAGDEPLLDEATALPLPDMDIAVHLPSNFRVSGYGLDIELSGELNVGRGFDEDGLPQPTVNGDLVTVLGTLKFMNRTFDVERGEVIFRGNAPPNPNLSLLLTTTVNGTLVRIMISGTATDPIIELSSEPSYEESDIMAVLLFGQPMNDLDNDQRGGVSNENDPGQELRQNLAGLAVVFGTAGMQNSVTSTVGVDMVEVGADSDGESTLMVGKFINPRLMVKYHHSLTKSGTYFVTMEYTLTRLFRLVSTYGQGEEDSGLELTWSRRY
ncbi:MAG: hypothetical protein ACI9UK_001375 [Candidatus Krumholzibacteriia bacterium]|jgi:hypothetical protein